MTDQFSLDVNPAELRSLATKLTTLGTHLAGKGDGLTATPGEIGDQWTGDASVTIKGEMTALGGHLTKLAPKFEASASALRSLAKDYEEAVDQIALLNKKWEATETAYNDAVGAADQARTSNLNSAKPKDGTPLNRAMRDEIDQIRSGAISAASDTRRTDQRNLNTSYGMTKQWLAHRTRQTGSAIDEALVVKVTPEQVAEYRSTSILPTGLDHSALDDLVLSAEKRKTEIEELAAQDAAEGAEEAAEDLAELEELLGDELGHIEDPAALQALLERMGGKAGDPHYSQALVEALGPGGLNDLYDKLDQSVSPIYGGDGGNPEDWAQSLDKFNDAIAAGLAQFDDEEVAQFASELAAPPDGSSPRFGMILGSDYADSRLRVIGLAFLDRMNDSKYEPGQPVIDVAERLLQAEYGGFEEMAESWSSNIDATEIATFLNELPPATAEWITEGLIDDGWNNHSDGPFHQDTWKIKEQVWLDILEASSTEQYPSAIAAMIHSVENGLNTPLADELLDEIATHFNDPAFITLLANNTGPIDSEEVARLAALLGDRINAADMIEKLLAARHETSGRGVANEIGYVLGLMDTAGTDIDFGPVFTEMLKGALGKIVDKVPAGSEILGVLEALIAAGAEADKKFKDFGEGWSQEAQHRVLAWSVYVAEHGEPPGFSQWMVDNENRVNDAEPHHAIELYMSDLAQSTDPAAQTEYERLLTYVGDIGRARDRGEG